MFGNEGEHLLIGKIAWRNEERKLTRKIVAETQEGYSDTMKDMKFSFIYSWEQVYAVFIEQWKILIKDHTLRSFEKRVKDPN